MRHEFLGITFRTDAMTFFSQCSGAVEAGVLVLGIVKETMLTVSVINEVSLGYKTRGQNADGREEWSLLGLCILPFPVLLCHEITSLRKLLVDELDAWHLKLPLRNGSTRNKPFVTAPNPHET